MMRINVSILNSNLPLNSTYISLVSSAVDFFHLIFIHLFSHLAGDSLKEWYKFWFKSRNEIASAQHSAACECTIFTPYYMFSIQCKLCQRIIFFNESLKPFVNATRICSPYDRLLKSWIFMCMDSKISFTALYISCTLMSTIIK